MNRILSISIFLAFSWPLAAQNNFFGVFKYHRGSSEPIAFNYLLELNCNYAFRITDSATNSIVFGTWFIKKHKELILCIDSTRRQSEISTKKRRWKYIIKDGLLYEKLLSESQYRKQNRHMNRLMTKQTGENSYSEDYETYKTKQENRYLLKNTTFSCP